MSSGIGWPGIGLFFPFLFCTTVNPSSMGGGVGMSAMWSLSIDIVSSVSLEDVDKRSGSELSSLRGGIDISSGTDSSSES